MHYQWAARRVEPMLQAVEGVNDQVAVEYRENGSPQTEQRVRRTMILGKGAKLRSGAVVVQQNAPVEIANDDTLVQLGH